MKETKEQLALWYYKRDVEGVPLTQDKIIQSFLEGFNSAEKKLLDKLNHYKSQLKELTSAKLDKRVNQDKVRELEIRIETLQDLLK
jgi:hypothetical protein